MKQVKVKVEVDHFRLALGAEIRRLRVARGLKRSELSSMLGVTTQFLGMVERGERAPALEKYGDYALVLGVEPSHFVEAAYAN